jgi:hypothetical protein
VGKAKRGRLWAASLVCSPRYRVIRAYTHFTDARNGRSSGGPAGGGTFPSQPGRNPACEQSDVFVDGWRASDEADGQNRPRSSDSEFLVTPCPGDSDGDDD